MVISCNEDLQTIIQWGWHLWWWAKPFSLIVSYGLHTSFINSLVQKNKNIHANPIKSLRFGLCHTFTPRPWKHGFAFTPQAWRYDTNQTLSIKIQLKRMIYLQQELGRAWVCLPLGISLGKSLGEGKPRLSLALVGGIYHTLFLKVYNTIKYSVVP